MDVRASRQSLKLRFGVCFGNDWYLVSSFESHIILTQELQLQLLYGTCQLTPHRINISTLLLEFKSRQAMCLLPLNKYVYGVIKDQFIGTGWAIRSLRYISQYC